MKSVLPLLFISMVGATSAFGQAPILSDSAESQTTPSDECLSRAERAFRDLGYNPVRYPSSVFADRGNDHSSSAAVIPTWASYFWLGPRLSP